MHHNPAGRLLTSTTAVLLAAADAGTPPGHHNPVSPPDLRAASLDPSDADECVYSMRQIVVEAPERYRMPEVAPDGTRAGDVVWSMPILGNPRQCALAGEAPANTTGDLHTPGR